MCLKKTMIMAYGVLTAAEVLIAIAMLDVVHKFYCLGATVSDNLSLDGGLNSCNRKAAATFTQLAKCVWENRKIILNTKIWGYQTCILNTLVYGGETWTRYSRHERRLNSFHTRCIYHIVNIKWETKAPDIEALEKAKFTCLITILKHRHLLGWSSAWDGWWMHSKGYPLWLMLQGHWADPGSGWRTFSRGTGKLLTSTLQAGKMQLATIHAGGRSWAGSQKGMKGVSWERGKQRDRRAKCSRPQVLGVSQLHLLSLMPALSVARTAAWELN